MTQQQTTTETKPNGAGTAVAAAKAERQAIVVRDDVALFDTGMFEHMYRIANAMAAMNLMPDHLKGKPADCMLVVEQARTWQMSPTAVGSKTFAVGGKLGYEGQLVAAVVNTRAGLTGRLNYRYEGEFNRAKPDTSTRKVIVSGTFNGEDEVREIEVNWTDGHAMSKGARDKWLSQPDQQLAYFAARVWARRHCPEVLLGVYTPEELEAEREHRGPDNARDVTPARPQRSDFVALPDTAKPAAEQPETVPYDAIDADGEIHQFGRPSEAADFVVQQFERRPESAQAIFEHNADLLSRLDEEGQTDCAHAIRHDYARLTKAAGEREGNQQQAAETETRPTLDASKPILPPVRADGNWTAWKNDALPAVDAAPADAMANVEAELAEIERAGAKIPGVVHSAVMKAVNAKKGKK